MFPVNAAQRTYAIAYDACRRALVISVITIACFCSIAAAEYTNALSASTFTVSSTGSAAFSSSNPATYSTVNGVASTVNLPAATPSDEIFLSNFGAGVPGGATITGIEATYFFRSNLAPASDTIVINVGSTGTPGTPKVLAVPDTGGDYVAMVAGGPADAWGLALTPAVVNAAGFGVFTEVETGPGSSGTYDLDHVRLVVHYTLAVDPAIRIDPPLVPFQDYDAEPLFVEIDWMTDTDHSHQPSQAVLDEIVATYARAGFQIVIDLSNEIPHQDVIDITPSLGGSAAIQALKNQYFDHRDDPNYYYSLWIHQYSQNGGSPTCSSGLGQLPGQVHLVSLGCFSGQVGTFSNQVGTFVHEFGHNLGLRHGGFQNQNYKPNYISVMNYHYQLAGISARLSSKGWVQTGLQFNTFGLSAGLLAGLTETGLDEHYGIGLGRSVDFNCDSDSIDSSIIQNIDNQSSHCFSISALANVQDNDDWGDVSSILRVAPAKSVADSEECITFEEYQLLPESQNEAAIDALNRSAAKADNGTFGFPIKWFTIFNDGGATLTITAATPDVASPWLSFNPALPLSIPAGESRLLQILVDRQGAPAGVTTRTVTLTTNDPSITGSFDWPEIQVTLPAVPTPDTFNISRADADPSNAATVKFDVEFTEDVNGVDASDFVLSTSGVLGAAITGVSGSGANYTVSVSTGLNSGTIQCNLIDNDSITSTATATPLGAAGIGNGNFLGGEIYHIDKSGGTVFDSTDAPKGIADDGTITSIIVIPGAKSFTTLSDVNVILDITHPNVEDLDVTLESPTGTVVELFSDVGGTGNNFTATILDDDAATPITAGSAPFTGSFVAEGNLEAYSGETSVGTWTLTITDDTPGNTGTLNSWSIAITGNNIPQGVPAANKWATVILLAAIAAVALTLMGWTRRRRGDVTG